MLHALSGTMAISETPLKDSVPMMVDQRNAKRGILGRKIKVVVVDPALDWRLLAAHARARIVVDGGDAIFGCWASVRRKAVPPVIEEPNELMLYPVRYEGGESSKTVI